MKILCDIEKMNNEIFLFFLWKKEFYYILFEDDKSLEDFLVKNKQMKICFGNWKKQDELKGE